MPKPKETPEALRKHAVGKQVTTPQIHTLDHEEVSKEWLKRIEIYGTEWVQTQTLFDMLNIIEGELQDRGCMGR